MNRHLKLIILMLSVLCIVSISAFSVFATETTVPETDTTATPEVSETTSEPAAETSASESETTSEPAAETSASESETTSLPEVTTAPDAVTPLTFTVTATPDSKTEYNEGEYFSPFGFLATVTFSNGNTKFFSSGSLKYLQTGPLTPDVKAITFVYDTLTFEIPITVTGSDRKVIDIEITSTKTNYLALDLIDPSSFSALLIYHDGSSETVDIASCSFFPELTTPLSASTKLIAVSYTHNGTTFTDSIEITVDPILSLDVSGFEGVKFYEATVPTAPTGLSVTAYFDEAKTVSKTVTDYVLSCDSELLKPNDEGKATVKLTVDTVTVEYSVEVIPIVNYRVVGLNEKYYYGDAFTFENTKVYAIYNDLHTENVTDQVIFEAPEIITANSKISATHNGYDLKEFLGCEFPSGKLVLITLPAKLKYEIGETFDKTGLTVGVDYSDGTRKFLTPDDYTITVSDPLTAADKVATISYHGVTASVSISVGDEAYITSLSIIAPPNVINYFEGSLLNTSGLIIEAYMSDGTKIIVNNSILTFTPALDAPLNTDVTEVKISANDGTDKYTYVSYPITVNAKTPTALLATSMPSKLTYKEGEIFNPDGLELSLIFNDSSSIIPSSYTFSPELGSALVLHSNATEKIIVYAIYEYEDKEFKFPIEIEVTPAATENLLASRYPAKTEYDPGETFDPAGLELILIYADRTIASPKVPDGYYSYTPSVITESTKEIVVTFRGHTVIIPITVKGVTSSEVTTAPEPPVTTPEPPETTEDTTDAPDVTTEDTTAEETTVEPEITTDPDENTSSPEDITTSGEDTTGENQGGKEKGSLLYLWIIIIAIILIALVALIIYYKKNFT